MSTSYEHLGELESGFRSVMSSRLVADLLHGKLEHAVGSLVQGGLGEYPLLSLTLS